MENGSVRGVSLISGKTEQGKNKHILYQYQLKPCKLNKEKKEKWRQDGIAREVSRRKERWIKVKDGKEKEESKGKKEQKWS